MSEAKHTEVLLTVTFTPDEFCMLARIVDTGMWELASKPHTAANAHLWDRVCAKLQVPGYTKEDEGDQNFRMVPVDPPLSLLPLLTNYSSVEGMSERDRGAILERLRVRWAAILAALPKDGGQPK